jgi:hypothetical protein
MTEYTDNNDQPIDPVKEASEALLYGDPEPAAEKLRNAIHAESDRMANVKAASSRVQRVARNLLSSRSRSFLQDRPGAA